MLSRYCEVNHKLTKRPTGFRKVRPLPFFTARGSCCYINDNRLVLVLKGGVYQYYNAVKQRSPVDSYLKTIWTAYYYTISRLLWNHREWWKRHLDIFCWAIFVNRLKNNAALVLMSQDELWEFGTLCHKRSGKCLGSRGRVIKLNPRRQQLMPRQQ